MMMVISRQAGDVRRDDSIATATRRWPPGDCSHRDLGTVTALPALVALLVKFARQRDEQGRHPRLRFQQVGWVSRAIPVRHGVPWPSRRCRTCWCVYTCVCACVYVRRDDVLPTRTRGRSRIRPWETRHWGHLLVLRMHEKKKM